jgi:hypothetical protein
MLAGAAVFALMVFVVSPRFSVGFPSIIDDWSAIATAPTALHDLIRLDYAPDRVRDPKRYRPGYTAVWTSLQWHTLGAPDHMTGPNVWNVVRLAMFTFALIWLVVAAAPRRTRQSPWLPAMAAAPGLLVLATPTFAADFARFGTVEPILVGGMIPGALLLLAGTARWLQGRRWTTVVPTIVGGYGLWLFGVYQKEVSICFLVLAPFLYLHLAERWREDGTSPGPPWRQRRFQFVAALMLLPVLHMLWQLTKISGGGETVYGTPIPSGASARLDFVRDALRGQWSNMPALLGTRLPVALALGASIGVVAAGVGRRRVPWLALGLVVTGWAVLTFQGLSGALATRYYIPEFALFAVALSAALLDAPALLRAIALAGVVWLAATNVLDSRSVVSTWAQNEKAGTESVFAAAALHPTTCPVYMGSMITEYADALPVLVARAPGGTSGPCDRRFAAMLVYGRTAQVAPATNEAIESVCARPGWVDLKQVNLIEVFGCKRIKTSPVFDQDPQRVLAENRLNPGVRYSDQSKRLRASP